MGQGKVNGEVSYYNFFFSDTVRIFGNPWEKFEKKETLCFQKLSSIVSLFECLDFVVKISYKKNVLSFSQTTDFRGFQTERVCRLQF